MNGDRLKKSLQPAVETSELYASAGDADLFDTQIGCTGAVQRELAQLAPQIEGAFIFGSVAKNKDTAKSDIDLFVITQHLTYRELFSALEPATGRLGRVVNPTVYSRSEFEKRLREGNAFVKRVVAQPKLWIIGDDRELSA